MYELNKDQQNFSGGEISPKLLTSTHLQRYKNGLSKCRNWVVEPTGSIRTRPTSSFVRNCSENSVLKPYVLDGAKSLIIEFKDGGAVAHDIGNSYNIAGLPYGAADLPNLNIKQLNDLIFISEGTKEIGLLKRHANNNWEFDKVYTYDGPFENENNEDGASITLTKVGGSLADLAVDFTYGSLRAKYNPYREYWRKNWHYVKITSNNQTISNDLVGSLIKVTEYNIVGISFFTANETFEIADLDAGLFRRIDRRVYKAVKLDNLEAAAEGEDPTKYTAGRLEPTWEDVYDYEPPKNTVKWEYVHSGYMHGHIIKKNTDGSAIAVFYGKPVDSLFGRSVTAYQIGSWNKQYGFPKYITFHQQRFVAAAHKLNERSIWTSAIDNYLNFDLTGLPNAAIAFRNPSAFSDNIKWIESNGELILGGENAETIVGRARTGDGFTIENILADQKSRVGSANIDPVVMPNSEILLVEKSAKKLIALALGELGGRPTPNDLSIMSEHLLKPGIKKIIIGRTPFTMIYCLLNDGTIACLTYERLHEVVAWSHFEMAGKILDIEVIPHNQDEQIWIKVERTNEAGQKKYSLEILNWDFEPATNDYTPLLDGMVQRSNAVASKEITDLAMFENQMVAVVSGDNIYENILVTGGKVVLDHAIKDAYIGFTFENLVTFLPSQFGMQDGGSDGRMRQCKGITLTLDIKHGCLVGDANDFDNMESLVSGDYNFLPYENDHDYKTGTVTVPIESEISTLDMLSVVQEEFYPTRILGITRHILLLKRETSGAADVH